MARNRKHILVTKQPRVDAFTAFSGRSPKPPGAPPGGRNQHAAQLTMALMQASADAASKANPVVTARPGAYVEFESVPKFELNVANLETRQADIEVLAVSAMNGAVQRAVVFVPLGEESYFLDRFKKYGNPAPKRLREPRYEDEIDRIAALRLATLQSFWTDDLVDFPIEQNAVWWEVWLRRTDGRELERVMEFAVRTGVEVAPTRLVLAERIIVLIRATAIELAAAVDAMHDLAELRGTHELASFFTNEPNDDQKLWAQDFLDRVTHAGPDAPSVTVLDTGVNRGHPLLAPALDPQDMHALHAAWGTHDDGGGRQMEGHGTAMAGLALYGDLSHVLPMSDAVNIAHRLESVKILPPRGSNDPLLYGRLTAEAVGKPEQTEPRRPRVFSMAITAEHPKLRGRATSWSFAVDALAVGHALDTSTQELAFRGGPHRLLVVSAGNVGQFEEAHLDASDLHAISDPAQAWNVLTVGAYTNLDVIKKPELKGWQPLAARGELSPSSRTSVAFVNTWPIKPDVVEEGGNVGHDGAGNINDDIDDLKLLTTHYKPAESHFVSTNATSAACAQVARLAARIMAEYPSLWPETVRALVVHSASWTPAMDEQFSRTDGKKRLRLALLRRYGFGVPSYERAVRSASNALTMIVQATLRPFAAGEMREMHMHTLPWPEKELEALGEQRVTMRVTLSHFIEPNPARRGWKSRFQYQSHALHFELRGATETSENFAKRLNKLALGDDKKRVRKGANKGWYLGAEPLKRGSLHSDIWEGTAADLARRGSIAVIPKGGWWKEQPERDRSDLGVPYALIVSIETPEVDTDIWTPVAQQVGVPIEVESEAQ